MVMLSDFAGNALRDSGQEKKIIFLTLMGKSDICSV